jgi:hypothetical protein
MLRHALVLIQERRCSLEAAASAGARVVIKAAL